MNKKQIILTILLCIHNKIALPINNVITLTFKEYPEVAIPESLLAEIDSSESSSDKTTGTLSKALEQPDYLQKKTDINKPIKSKISGIWTLHKGFARTSDYFGQIVFPRKQQSETVYLIITEKIAPSFIVGPSTVSNWTLDPTAQTAMYAISLEFDDDANSYYFNTEKIDPPADNQISLQSIIIPGNPDTVYVPTGATITELTSNLTLPDIYIKNDFDHSYNASYILNNMNYFEKIEQDYQQADKTIVKLLLNS